MSFGMYIMSSFVLSVAGLYVLAKGSTFGVVMLMAATIPVGVMVIEDLEKRKGSISEMVYEDIENDEEEKQNDNRLL